MVFKLFSLLKRKLEVKSTVKTNSTPSHRQIKRMYKSDWMIERKYGSLMIILGMISEGADEPGDIDIAIRITKEIEYLIEVSPYIPMEYKEEINLDNLKMREFFQGLSVIH